MIFFCLNWPGSVREKRIREEMEKSGWISDEVSGEMTGISVAIGVLVWSFSAAVCEKKRI